MNREARAHIKRYVRGSWGNVTGAQRAEVERWIGPVDDDEDFDGPEPLPTWLDPKRRGLFGDTASPSST